MTHKGKNYVSCTLTLTFELYKTFKIRNFSFIETLSNKFNHNIESPNDRSSLHKTL